MQGENGEPRFCLADICKPLGLLTKKVIQRLNDEVISNYAIPDRLGREHLMTFINEDGQ